MASEKDYAKLYGQAYAAYGQGNYTEAVTYIDEMAEAFPQDPNVLLLQGHISIGLEHYDVAQQKYEQVLQLSDRQDLVECAQAALAQIQGVGTAKTGQSFTTMGTASEANGISWKDSIPEDWDMGIDDLDWDSAVFSDEDFGEPTLGKTGPEPSATPLGESPQAVEVVPAANPFTADPFESQAGDGKIDWDAAATIDWDSELFREEVAKSDDEDTMLPDVGASTFVVPPSVEPSPALNFAERGNGQTPFDLASPGAEASPAYQAWMDDETDEDLDSLLEHENVPTVQSSPTMAAEAQNLNSATPGFEPSNFDDLADFDLTDLAPELPDSSLFTQAGAALTASSELQAEQEIDASATLAGAPPPGMVTWLKPEEGGTNDFSGASSRFVKPTVEIDPGWLGWFTNAPLKRKQLYLALATGLASGLAVIVVNAALAMGQGKTSPPATPPTPGKTASKPAANSAPAPTVTAPSPLVVAGLTGLVTALATFLVSNLLVRQVKQTIDDLQNQFDAIYEGNFNVRAKVRSEDELGQLAQRFNYISQVILTATSEAQERAAATEKAREKLQRQVIRLLDDVEGASRGDLTVQAEVTADELGAVADAFNLTIQNLREIVLQVKKAAKQVNRNCTDSESFARNNSSDALRMAEELAVTLNSVQLMTESIQRVAENAREAEEVAHTSSLTALKGGEAVERTVGGILQIRETVSETARKVKRLAEASQEISKIVAVISQIASRTNLLALNASIQAARAGEAGRGFAIVADEVRQLADRSAKSLKDIEQIVLQIQSETGSVMTAMEEGIQQVIDVTDKSEQSKRALEDIIEVSNRINTLVRSITADTVRQQENSSSVAQVMQSIELTAQETSQESQRVAGSLQTLVSISRDLLTSVERFRLEQSLK
ncbi:methyl-accepting chemotaxis protein [Synechocystis sp. LKSZ1]|uniref:methyl-accepting chemotaxis protein n=1 Tax=Synechocystis sp. LKSZ1 TaxID=3144951 RepID=UPI00336BF3D3